LTPLGATASAQEYKAQQPGNVYRIGFLGPAVDRVYTDPLLSLRAGLGERGYVEGKNIPLYSEGR
jgi:hypothetical protein